jgi:SAM-dependent methyltransferase
LSGPISSLPPPAPDLEPPLEETGRGSQQSPLRRVARRAAIALGLRGKPAILFQSPAEVAEFFADAAAAAAAGDAERFTGLLWQHDRALLQYLRTWHVEGAPRRLALEYVGDAQYRFWHTLALVPLPPPARILEIGSNPYYFHILLHKLFPSADIQGVNFFDRDIFSRRQDTFVQTTRNDWTGERFAFSSRLLNLEATARYPYPGSWFDLVFFCETLEHLVVDPLAVLGRLKRILRPGGLLLITVPNAVRLTNFALMLHGHNFFDRYHGENGVYGRHNREFTLAELEAQLRGRGYQVVRAETHDRTDYDWVEIITDDYTGRRVVLPETRRRLLAKLRKSGGTLANRGDNLYLLARRPLPGEPGELRDAPPDAPSDGLAVPGPPSAGELGRLVVTVDQFADTPRSLTIRGWAYRKDGDRPRQSAHLILDSPAARYAFRAAGQWREDVAEAHALEWDDPGFHLDLDKSRLRPGCYRLALLVCSSEAPSALQPLELETVMP